jgi:hypothetical protein
MVEQTLKGFPLSGTRKLRTESGASGYYLTTIGTSVLTAQTRAMIHPITDHPRKKFSSRIAPVSRLLRAKAIMVGRKYITKPNPKNGKKNAKGCIVNLLTY